MKMMIKERKDVRPLMVKFGVALAISFAGYLYARIRTKCIRPSDSPPSLPPPSSSDSNMKVDYGGRLRIKDDHQPEMDTADSYENPCIRVRADTSSSQVSPSGDKDGFLLPEFDELVKDLNASTVIDKGIPKTIYSVERDEKEHEIENLKRRVRYHREKERKLEVQLLEYYGLKEQEKAMTELQNRVKINNIEAKLFSMKIESLEAENKRLKSQVVDYSKVVYEFEDAKAKIKLLKRKIRHETQLNKEQILDLTQRVIKLRDQEHEAVHSELHKMTDLATEADELRKSNVHLQQENADLVRRLESTQFLANSILDDPEKEELNKEALNLREENEKLTKEVERLQSDRCADAEELVYLRWINACLRYELRHYRPPPGKTIARDLSTCLSPNSEKKAKHLILEYATEEGVRHKHPSIVDFDFDNWPSSSQPSYLTDSTEHDESTRHSSDNKHHHKNLQIFARLRRVITGKHGPDHHNQSGRVSLIYRSHSVDDLKIPKFASSSQNSNNSSLEDSKDIENASRMSDSRSSHGSESTNNYILNYWTEKESEDGQKSELAKYAEVLRDSRSLPRLHKKSASYSVLVKNE